MRNPQNPRFEQQLRRFRKTGIAAVTLAYLVILAGGIVRMTGSGMGCPDWPMCFGQWIPPTEEAQLPADYQTRYNVHGHGVAEFNAFKTWTEYLNRLIGALAGVGALGFALAGLPFWRRRGWRSLGVLSLTSLLLLMLVAWLGAKVVSTNLAGSMITIHMMLALALIGTLLAGILGSLPAGERVALRRAPFLRGLALAGLLVILVQIGLGTQTREAVDRVSDHLAAGDRARWLEEAGLIFLVHRSFSWLVVLASLVMLMLTRRWQGLRGRMGRAVLAQNGLMLLVFGLGVILAKLDLPPAAQPLHLWLAALLAGSQFIVVWGSFQWLSRPQAAALTPTAKHTAQALPKRPAEEPLHH